LIEQARFFNGELSTLLSADMPLTWLLDRPKEKLSFFEQYLYACRETLPAHLIQLKSRLSSCAQARQMILSNLNLDASSYPWQENYPDLDEFQIAELRTLCQVCNHLAVHWLDIDFTNTHWRDRWLISVNGLGSVRIVVNKLQSLQLLVRAMLDYQNDPKVMKRLQPALDAAAQYYPIVQQGTSIFKLAHLVIQLIGQDKLYENRVLWELVTKNPNISSQELSDLVVHSQSMPKEIYDVLFMKALALGQATANTISSELLQRHDFPKLFIHTLFKNKIIKFSAHDINRAVAHYDDYEAVVEKLQQLELDKLPPDSLPLDSAKLNASTEKSVLTLLSLYPTQRVQLFVLDKYLQLTPAFREELCQRAASAVVIDKLITQFKGKLPTDQALRHLLNNAQFNAKHLATISSLPLSEQFMGKNGPINEATFNKLLPIIPVSLVGRLNKPEEPANTLWELLVKQAHAENSVALDLLRAYLKTVTSIISIGEGKKVTSDRPILFKTKPREAKEKLFQSALFELNLLLVKENRNDDQIKKQFNALCKVACRKRNALNVLFFGEYSTGTNSARILIDKIRTNNAILNALGLDVKSKNFEAQLEKKMLQACRGNHENQDPAPTLRPRG